MVFYGSAEHLAYFALRRTHTGKVKDMVMKTSGEYLLNGELSEVIKIVMLNSIDTSDILDDIDSSVGNHINDDFNLVETIAEAMLSLS